MQPNSQTSSLLHSLLSLLTKNDSEKEKKEIKRYDDLRFLDVNKEIKKANKKQHPSEPIISH